MNPALARLKARLGGAEWQAAEALVRRGLVSQLYCRPEKAEYVVAGDPCHLVVIPPRGSILTDGGPQVSRYTAAALLAAERDGTLAGFARNEQDAAAAALLGAVTAALPVADTLRLEIIIRPRAGGMAELGLRVGESRLYAVRDIPAFLACWQRGASMPFGRHFVYEPRWARFPGREQRVLGALLLYADALPEEARRRAGRSLPVPPLLLNSVLEELADAPFVVEMGEKRRQQGIAQRELPLTFTASGSEKGITLTARLPSGMALRPLTGRYFLLDGEAVAFDGRYVPLLNETLGRLRGGEAAFVYPRERVPQLMGDLFPFLLGAGVLAIAEDLDARMIRLPLKARVYLDRDGQGITARTVFAYGAHEIDPFVLSEDAPPLLLRDAQGEKSVMDALSQAGFKVRRGYAFMQDEDDVYRFVQEGVNALSKAAELYFSNEFRRIRVRAPQLSGALRASGARLELDMFLDGEKVEELLPLLRAIRRRKGYFRFTDGTFLDLTGAAQWQPLAEAVLEAAPTEGGAVGLYHAAYLNALVKEQHLPVTAGHAVLSAAALRYREVASPIGGLYAYQQRGFEWLCALYRLRMGGILADEMGLGKTVQTLAAVQWARDEESERLPSLVVTPTSLTYNWLREAQRFAPGLTARLISGARAQRESQLAAALAEKADLIVLSYPTLRQDKELHAQAAYRFVVLDEAQNIKNPASLSAEAVKSLSALCRVALSGTPMENNVGELWSLFDFALPGYLPPLRAFLPRYGDGRNADDLRRRLAPFLMRRLKSDVMAELPEKIETTLYAGMGEEQRRLYAAVLLKRRESVRSLLEREGLSGSRGEVLAAMTELRQICCHPELVLPGYQGGSGKEDLLLDILPGLLAEGRRVLIFSQFTRMLRLLEERLALMGETPLYLDGDTPPKERLSLAERFNRGEGRLFLISLKAGGTGLNLTGADTVIHFDPWWNPTAEDQATDRAHRLGQRRHVQVIRLVTERSIEEKVVALGVRKRRLFDTLITAGEAQPARLTRQDILSLFE